jgi:hypothetical protein
MTSLPPFLIYQGKAGQVQDSWLTEFDPEHQSAFFTTSETGLTNHELGKEWLVGVFDRFTKAKARNGRDYHLLILTGTPATLIWTSWSGATSTESLLRSFHPIPRIDSSP